MFLYLHLFLNFLVWILVIINKYFYYLLAHIIINLKFENFPEHLLEK